MSDLPPAYPLTPPRARDDLPLVGAGSAAGIGARLAARVIDMILLSLPFAPFTKIVNNQISPHWVAFGTIVATLVYDVVCVAGFGMTIGKRAFGIRVARYTDGGRPTPSQAALRAVVPSMPTFLAYVPAIDWIGIVSPLIYLSALVDPVRRGIHDKAAGTIVLRTR